MITDGRSVGFHWLMQRITAIFLAVGLLVHFFVLHVAVERPITLTKVQERLSSPGWVVFDVLLLGCVLYHALNGLRGIILDYAVSPKMRRIVIWGLWVVGLGAFVIGVLALIPFAVSGGNS